MNGEKVRDDLAFMRALVLLPGLSMLRQAARSA
jgi:hypothetical protein